MTEAGPGLVTEPEKQITVHNFAGFQQSYGPGGGGNVDVACEVVPGGEDSYAICTHEECAKQRQKSAPRDNGR